MTKNHCKSCLQFYDKKKTGRYFYMIVSIRDEMKVLTKNRAIEDRKVNMQISPSLSGLCQKHRKSFISGNLCMEA